MLTPSKSFPPKFLTPAQFHILLAGLLIGAATAVFPACGNILTDARTFAFSSTQYGSLFVVQTLLAILSSLISPRISRAIGDRLLLKVGLVSSTLAMLMLIESSLISSSDIIRYWAVLLAIAFMGVGIGFTITVANVLSASAWSDRPQRGVAALHTMIGLGLALSPFGVTAGIAISKWWLAPVIVSLFLIWLASKLQVVSGSTHSESDNATFHDSHNIPRAVIMLGVLAFLYGVAEATFSNWCVIYLHDRAEIGIAAAGLALSGFWASVTLGRVAYTAANHQVGKLIALVSLPIMAFSFLLISLIHISWIQILGFIAAGIGCASVYPALLVRATALQTSRRQFVSGLMVATVLAGTGTGTYLTAAIMEHFNLELDEIYRIAALIPAFIFVFGFTGKPNTQD